MFALNSQKKTIVVEALTRVDEHFAGGEAVSEFATIIGDFADFCDIRGQRVHVLGTCLNNFTTDGNYVEFTILGTNVQVCETTERHDYGDFVANMRLWWLRKNPSGMIVGRLYTPEFEFISFSYATIAERIMTAIEKNSRCEFCGVLLDIYQSYQPMHMCNECAMTEGKPCKNCKLTTGRQEDGAHRMCKRRRLN
jgi:hypothetical protein